MVRSAISLILYTDSKSLYDYLVKLETTQEKQLMVDVMSLSQLYEQQEMIKVKWIHGHYNLADFIIKVKSLPALKTLIDTNCINISTME